MAEMVAASALAVVVVLPAGEGGWGELVAVLAGNSDDAAVVAAAAIQFTLHRGVALGFRHEQFQLMFRHG